MIPKGATIDYGKWTEIYLGLDGLVVWYRRDTFGPEWPSSSYMLIMQL